MIDPNSDLNREPNIDSSENVDEEYLEAAADFEKTIDKLLTKLNEDVKTLGLTKGEMPFRELMRYFTEDIHLQFLRYTLQREEKYYKVLKSSENGKKTAQEIIMISHDLAKIFERYAESPDTYSWVDVRELWEKLVLELRNVKYFCLSREKYDTLEIAWFTENRHFKCLRGERV